MQRSGEPPRAGSDPPPAGTDPPPAATDRPPAGSDPPRTAAELPPSVDALARAIADVGLPAPLLVDAARAAIAAGDPASARQRAAAVEQALLRPVINATGVLLHTNLGRAPLGISRPPRAANLEIDLASGRRSGRRTAVGALLARAAGAEAAIVVNNGAAAVLLVLATLAAGRAVVVSRGELVEIGGGFRIPEVLESSGARLVEVGTTNRTRLSDYERAVTSQGGAAGADVALVLKVHPSNYRLVGFTESVPVARLARLGVPVVADIGSGLLDAAAPWLPDGPPDWLEGEPAARQTLAAGAALVTFSADKLLGGPQGGVIAGRADLVAACARHPLMRALRPGGLVLEALQSTALAYLRRDGLSIPFWRMATAGLPSLLARAEAVAALSGGRVVRTSSLAGAGSLPGRELPSAGVLLEGDLGAELRRQEPPVVARVRDGATVADLRTVDPDDDLLLASALSAASSRYAAPERRD
jgi:L-seryl-tRNA(Ser) seleniumtransferase